MRRLLLTTSLIAVISFSIFDTASARCFRRRSCACGRPVVCAATRPPEALSLDTFTSPKGNVYRFYLSGPVPSSESEEFERSRHERKFAAPSAARSDQDFDGSDRMAAKTSISNAQIEDFDSLSDILATLQTDNFMRTKHDPPLEKDPDFGRVEEEERNVRVRAWLYAAKKEDDNDYHLLLGNSPNARSGASMMTAEITGLPHGGDRERLKKPREAFREFFGDEPPSGRYKVFPDPIPVQVVGSLFYDIDHPPGKVGTGDYFPRTAWEIHPVATIDFEP